MKNFLIIGLALSLLMACGQAEKSITGEVKAQNYSWSLVTTWPKNYPGLGMAPERFSKLVEEMTQGQLKVTVYGAGEFVPAMGVFDAVSSGAVEMGHGGAYYWKGKVPAAQFFASVPFGLSENLSIPIVNIVKDIKIQDQKLQMERVITDGFQKVEAETPVIVTTGNQVGDPRYPTLKGIMSASKKEITKISLSDLEITDEDINPKVRIEEVYFPENDNKVEIIEGHSTKEKAINLISKLKEEGVI